MRRILIAAGTLAVLVTPQIAAAGPLAASDILGQFNLVDFGNLTSGSDVEGRSLVGGNVSGSSESFGSRPLPASAYGTLTVGGSASNTGLNVSNGSASGSLNVAGSVSNTSININNNSGTTQIGGSLSNSSLNVNGGSYQIGGAISGSTVNANGATKLNGAFTVANPTSAFQSTLNAFQTQLAGLNANSSTSIANSILAFNATPVNGLAVFSITAAQLSLANTSVQINLNGAAGVIINVSGSGADFAENFVNTPQATATKVIWNFFNDTTTLKIDREIYGTVLADLAAVTNTANVDGTLVANSLVQQGEVHQYLYDGTVPSPPAVPEPASLALVASGLAGAGFLRARRTRKA